MSTIFTIMAVSLLVLSSLVAPVPTKSRHDNPQPLNKSPCFPEEVEACRSSGGTFDWSHCLCNYN